VMRLGRRAFLRNVSIAGSGLVLGVTLQGCGADSVPWPDADGVVLQPNAFLQIRGDGAVTLIAHKAEMGQGVTTGLATLVAEELEIDPLALEIRFAEPHPDYADPEFRTMVTGGSASIAVSFEPLRQAGAAMREMLRQAAAQRWGAALSDCVAADGAIRLRDGSRQAAYGELAADAARLPVPTGVALKKPGEWRLIGRHDARVDARAKVDGSAQFSLDVNLPGMLTAVMLRCPQAGGTLKGFNADKALALGGVRAVRELDGAVAVVADGYWTARSAAALVELEWDAGERGALDSAGIVAARRALLDTESGRVVREDGDRPGASPVRVVEAEYHMPYLAHAPMEPLNAVASVTAHGAEIWAGNQAPDMLRNLAARLLDLPYEAVVVHNTFLGGGFGRRANIDYALEAVRVSRAMGAPVKVVWSREDDLRHGHYRPAALSRLRAGIDADGKVTSWEQRMVAPSIMALMIPSMGGAMLPRWLPAGVMKPLGAVIRSRDESSFEGASQLPYRMPYLRVEYLYHDPGVPVGVWRSVGHSQNAFYTESFVDELAHAVDADPVAFRLERLAADSREAAVLRLAAQKAGWGSPAPGVFQGAAVHESFGTVVAEIVEVAIENGSPRVRRVVCAADCGTVINPDVVRQQLESAVVFALSAALHGEITIANGAVVQGNFDDYLLLRLAECPVIEVYTVASEATPTGIGEPGVPPLAPALANAIFAATGKRLRELPLRLS